MPTGSSRAIRRQSETTGRLGRTHPAVVELQDLIEHIATTTVALTVGLFAGVLIGGAARRLHTRFKSGEAWPFGLIRSEVRFARWLCRWAWLRAIVPDAWEDMRRLSAQLAGIGLPTLPTMDPSDAESWDRADRYLAVIQPHLTSSYRMPVSAPSASSRRARPGRGSTLLQFLRR